MEKRPPQYVFAPVTLGDSLLIGDSLCDLRARAKARARGRVRAKSTLHRGGHSSILIQAKLTTIIFDRPQPRYWGGLTTYLKAQPFTLNQMVCLSRGFPRILEWSMQ